MKLFNVCLYYGMAVVVANNVDEVIDLINENKELSYSFTDMQGNKFSKEDILKYISEISGYEVNGSVGIISYYKEWSFLITIKTMKALEIILRISAVLASICLLMLIWTYSIFFLYAAFVLAVIILISLIILNYLTTSSES